jgi:hypothetical protein
MVIVELLTLPLVNQRKPAYKLLHCGKFAINSVSAYLKLCSRFCSETPYTLVPAKFSNLCAWELARHQSLEYFYTGNSGNSLLARWRRKVEGHGQRVQL